MYRLYHAPRSTALGVQAVLETIGAPYELSEVDIYSDEPRDPEFLRINPNGWVPDLVSACDVYLYMLSTWLSDGNTPISEFPNVARCLDKVAARPEVARVFA